MRRLLAFIGGLLSGGTIGTAIGLLFTPTSGDSMRNGIRQHFSNAVRAGQEAAVQKRQELEDKWIALTTPASQED